MRPSTMFAALLLAVLPAAAGAGGPLYLTGAIQNASTSIDISTDFERLIDDDGEGWSFGVGFHISEHLSIEGTYQDFGDARELGICSDPAVCIALVAPATAESTATTISVLPHWPLTEHVSIYGRIGIATWETDVDLALAGATSKIDDEELIVGAGVRFEVLGPLGVYAEVSRIADTFETVSLGATLGF